MLSSLFVRSCSNPCLTASFRGTTRLMSLPASIIGNDITLYGCGLRWDLPGAVKLLSDGSVDTTPLITHEFPLEKTKEAFDTQLSSPEAIKVLVKP